MYNSLFFLMVVISHFNGFAQGDLTKKDDHVKSVLTKSKIEYKLVLSASEGSHLSGYCDQDFEFSRTSNLHEYKNDLYFQKGLLLDGDDVQWVEFNSL